MLTIFHLFELIGAFAGVVVGVAVGKKWLGWVGVVLGAILGLFGGWMLGRVPYAIVGVILKRSLKRCDIATLRARLDSEYYLSHLIIAELLIRGEPIESFRDYVSALLHSDSADRRRFGEQVLHIWSETAQPTDSHK